MSFQNKMTHHPPSPKGENKTTSKKIIMKFQDTKNKIKATGRRSGREEADHLQRIRKQASCEQQQEAGSQKSMPSKFSRKIISNLKLNT